ncbi:hypothetical protein GCM10023331_12780 [Algivirga pacifica]|uniref:PPM-type phosphatase domain-containing protein n=2 Tax=Algivirga pacifica TaxID=1162670 RepID=A0ABP9D5X0_9BACT
MIISIVLLFLGSLTWGNAGNPLTSIGKKVHVLEDPSHTITIDDLLKGRYDNDFVAYDQEVPNFQATNSAYWVRFDRKYLNPFHDHLGVGSAFLDTVMIYEVTPQKEIVKEFITGDAYPASQREIAVGDFIFRLSDRPDTEVFLKVSTVQPLFFPLRTGTLHDFIAFEHDLDFVQGIYFGFMILIFLYNFFIWLTTRDSIYLIYVAYVLSITVFMGAVFGYMFEYLWPEVPILNEYVVISSAFTQIFAVAFTIRFVKKSVLPKVLLYLNYLYIAWGVLIIGCILADYKVLALMLSQVGLLTLGILLIVTGSVSLAKGYKPAKYYLSAWGCLVVGLVFGILESVNVLEVSTYLNPMQVGSALEVLFLSFALGDKLNSLKKEKEQAQKVALEAARVNEKMVREQNTVLEYKVAERTQELSQSNEELKTLTEELYTTIDTVKSQSNMLEEAHHNIQSSIKYARRIQNAILPDIAQMEKVLSDCFIYYEPKDVVSGDFYWFKQRNGLFFLAAVDCTGHGVPGGFLSMLGSELLNEVVTSEVTNNPGEIIQEVNKRIKEVLRQTDTNNMDGMDMALCVIDPQQRLLSYAGAKNPLVYLEGDELVRVKGSIYSVGGNLREGNPTFETHIFKTTGKKFYIFSDGYQDQSGGAYQKKFMSKRFREVLQSTAYNTMDMKAQKEQLIHILNEWRGVGSEKEEKQVDDILVIGFEV